MGAFQVDAGTDAIVDWAVAGRALPGQELSGDAYLVRLLSGEVLLAVFDGLGHGAEAAEASAAAIDAIEDCAPAPLEILANFCHERIRPTRGVALTLASIDVERSEMVWLGVGNVEGVLSRPDEEEKRETLLLRNGIVGDRLPPLKTSTLPVEPGDLLVIATDGVCRSFIDEIDHDARPAEIASAIIGNCTRENDDALVLVALIGDRTP